MSLFSSIQVSSSGMAAQRTRAELLVENMANSETTRTPEGGPYRRKDVVFSSDIQASPFSAVFQNELGDGRRGFRRDSNDDDQREPDLRYLPGHPDADADGYVAFPTLNPAEDMVDLLNSTRSYQANVAAITSRERHDQRSIDLMK